MSEERAMDPAERPAPPPGTVGPIVVGHDGSENADVAFELALELAAALSAEVLVVRAWSIDTAPRGALFHDDYVTPFVEVNAIVRNALIEHTVMRARRHPQLTIEYRGELGDPAEVLLRASAGARMLVVGSRGRGGFAALLLGSTSEKCVRHAHCPVLVVPAAVTGS